MAELAMRDRDDNDAVLKLVSALRGPPLSVALRKSQSPEELLQELDTHFGGKKPKKQLLNDLSTAAQSSTETVSVFADRVCAIIQEIEDTYPGFAPASPKGLSQLRAEYVGQGMRFEYRGQLRYLLNNPEALTYEKLLQAARELEADKEFHKSTTPVEKKKSGIFQLNTQVARTQAKKDLYTAPKTGRTQPDVQVRSAAVDESSASVAEEAAPASSTEAEGEDEPADLTCEQWGEFLVRATTAYEAKRKEKDAKEGRCYICHEVGHMAHACPLRKENQGNDNGGSAAKGNRPPQVKQDKVTVNNATSTADKQK